MKKRWDQLVKLLLLAIFWEYTCNIKALFFTWQIYAHLIRTQIGAEVQTTGTATESPDNMQTIIWLFWSSSAVFELSLVQQ